MKIIGTWWFSGSFGTIAIVTGEDDTTGKKKAYIGTCSGNDEDEDKLYVAEHGSPVDPMTIRAIAKELE